jgi:hypothetical protein
MAFNRNKYFKNGLIDLSLLKFDERYVYKYVIPFEYEGRPDLISLDIYGDVSYQSFLTYYNRVSNSPKGYKRGTTLRFVDKSMLE